MSTAKNKRLEMERSVIEKCCRKLGVDELDTIAQNCAKSIINSSLEKIVSGGFEMPSHSDIGEMIRKDLDWDFDEEKVVADIKHAYSNWDEELVYTELDKLDDIYEEECSSLLEPIVKTTIKACLAMIEEFRKEGNV